MTSQCFCMNSVSGRDGCWVMRCTQWPTSESWSGISPERRPLLIGSQVAPASSLRNAPAAEMATKIRSLLHRVQDDRVQAQAAGARLPCRPGRVGAQRGELLPLLATVVGHVERGVLGAGVHGVGVVAGRLEVPDPLELPRPGGAVVPEVLADLALVGEVVADRGPRSCRRRRSAGSPARTSRPTATRRAGSGRPATR